LRKYSVQTGKLIELEQGEETDDGKNQTVGPFIDAYSGDNRC
jgi:hypothetical protein